MRNIIILALMALVAFSSCKKEEENDIDPGYTTVTISGTGLSNKNFEVKIGEKEWTNKEREFTIRNIGNTEIYVYLFSNDIRRNEKVTITTAQGTSRDLYYNGNDEKDGHHYNFYRTGFNTHE